MPNLADELRKAETVQIQDFLKDMVSVSNKMVRANHSKVIIAKGEQELFFFTKYNKLTSLINEITDDLGVKKHQLKKKQVSYINKANLSTAENSLLKNRDKFAFFRDMSDDDVLEVTGNVLFLKLKNGEILFEQGGDGKEIYYIMSGAVDVMICDRVKSEKYIKVAELKTGNLFGEMSAITGEPRSARIVSNNDMTTLLSFEIKKEVNSQNAKALAVLYRNFNLILAEKIVHMNERLLQK